jgi:AcrR family transcriptional regulator
VVAVSSTTFVRARSEQQREARRAAILATAADMLRADTRVAELSLNELSRRVGLAKSNVLRYFETREAVLLELLDAEYDAWLVEVTAALPPDPEREDAVERVADVLSRTVADRPVLAELLASASAVLEHNVSAEVAASYKRRSVEQAERLVGLVEGVVGPLPGPSRIALAGAVVLVVGGSWSMCRPSPGMAAAYERYPELAAMRLDYRVTVRELLATVLTGLLARPVSPIG